MNNEQNKNDAYEKAYKFWTKDPEDNSLVNSPAHYTSGSVDVINVIEDAVKHADDPACAVLQANVIKYVLRMWLKGNAKQDAEKAEWYLSRLIDRLEANNE